MGHRSGFLVKKEAKVDQDDVDELLRLIETSGFLEAIGPAHSGVNLTDGVGTQRLSIALTVVKSGWRSGITLLIAILFRSGYTE